MKRLGDLAKNNQSFLLKRVLHYAKLHNYAKYTSTLEEAWAASIAGLTAALVNAIALCEQVPEIDVDTDFAHDPLSSFGVMEAQKHRQRGVTLEMFLGLMKYYRQTYLDLIAESVNDRERRQAYTLWVTRFFDHIEISFCYEWVAQTPASIIEELQAANRSLTNEKNKYVTIFESMSTPAVLLDAENRCINRNYAAQQIFGGNPRAPGFIYYSDFPPHLNVHDLFPWLSAEFTAFNRGDELEATVEKDFTPVNQPPRKYIVKFHRMLDVSNKFTGTVILFDDITELKKVEEQLRQISFRDLLTGLYNRNYLEQEIVRVSTGRFNPVGFISLDVDGLKLVNDTCGHSAGDTLLITVGRIAKSCFRDGDLVARTGGDEFALLLPLSDAGAVQKACERIRKKAAAHNRANPAMPVSVSIGWSVGNVENSNAFHQLIIAADSAMYLEKPANRLKYAAQFNDRLARYGQDLFRSRQTIA